MNALERGTGMKINQGYALPQKGQKTAPDQQMIADASMMEREKSSRGGRRLVKRRKEF